MMITILMSCLSTNLTAPQRDALEARVKWIVVNTRLGRALLDIQGEREDVQWVYDRLLAAGKDPIVIAAFRTDTGQRIKSVPINVAAYLAVAPDIKDMAQPQIHAWARPVAYFQCHGYLGLAEHLDQEEP